MNVYQVRDWDANFENDRSRVRMRCHFVCVPNKQHGMGLTHLISEPDGPAIYGTFHLIIGACSQQHAPRQGWLTMTGQIDGIPWTPRHLSVKFRRPEPEMARALDVLTSNDVGWLQVFDYESDIFQSRLTHHQLTTNSPPTHLEENRREQKGTEGKGAPHALTMPSHLNSENFLKSWNEWVQCRMKGRKVKDFNELFARQLVWLAGYPEPVAIQILSYSTRNNYQGLFEPKGYAPNQQNRPGGYDRNRGTANEGLDFTDAARRSQEKAGILPGLPDVQGKPPGDNANGSDHDGK